MASEDNEKFIRGLQKAWLAEQKSLRLYRALGDHESDPARKKVMFRLAENEQTHADRWSNRLR